MDTVDASEALAGFSTSGGSLNLVKALDYLDDIVVFNDATVFGEYSKGTLVPLVGGQEMPMYAGNMCDDPDPDVTALPKDVRRIVTRKNGQMSWVEKDVPDFEYKECKINEGFRFRLKASDGKKDRDFAISEVREIVPRPYWAKTSK